MIVDILSNVLDQRNAPAFEATAQVSSNNAMQCKGYVKQQSLTSAPYSLKVSLKLFDLGTVQF